ncbi:MAG: complex I NDUFA9 subunit family protein [Alphaproteobacteria bacterium]|nr:complex I NDUFA9 subunit family protein [Alphaproteobacteria bacterium]
MTCSNKIVSIIGGSGFIGSYIVRAFAQQGARIKVISRNPQKSDYLKTCGTVGQIELIPANISNESVLRDALRGSDIVINATGILYEKGRQRFVKMHSQIPESIAKVASELSIPVFIHLSALGANHAISSAYASSKINGEKAVLAAFPKATILRPSVVFGHEDQFFNLFGRLSALSPMLPLIGGGKTLFQPVYVDDIAKAVVFCATHAETQGNIYELGGPDKVSFKHILTFILEKTHRHRLLLPIPFTVAKTMGMFLKLLPHPLLTDDQVELLKYNNIVDEHALGFKHLGITPQTFEIIATEYLR